MRGPDWDVKARFPSIVLETGWAEPAEKLAQDARLWQKGSEGEVRVVLQVKFYKRAHNRIGTRLWINRATPPTEDSTSVKISIKRYVSLFLPK